MNYRSRIGCVNLTSLFCCLFGAFTIDETKRQIWGNLNEHPIHLVVICTTAAHVLHKQLPCRLLIFWHYFMHYLQSVFFFFLKIHKVLKTKFVRLRIFLITGYIFHVSGKMLSNSKSKNMFADLTEIKWGNLSDFSCLYNLYFSLNVKYTGRHRWYMNLVSLSFLNL
jgi:hypothetical protein